MRGGGTKGTYEAGALRGIIEALDPLEYSYDVVSGVSVGAVNSVMLAIYPKGKEADAVTELETIWRTHLVQDLYQNWPGLSIVGGFWKDSLFDSSPLKQFANLTLSGRKL